MKVRILIGAETSYACIKTDKTSLDVRLSPGKSARASLIESALEMREQALRLLTRAKLIEEASDHA